MVLLALALFAERVGQSPLIIQIPAHMLPITDAAICLKYVLIEGQQKAVETAGGLVMQTESVFWHPSFYFLLLNCVLWTFVGITCFRIMENHSRNKGTLGAY